MSISPFGGAKMVFVSLKTQNLEKKEEALSSHHQKSAHRLSVIGELLSTHLKSGELRSCIQKLSNKVWKNPKTGVPVKYSFSTIERWYYRAKKEENPYEALKLKQRSDAGRICVFTSEMLEFFERQYVEYPKWTVKLHHDNFLVWAKRQGLKPPCYNSTMRLFRSKAWDRSRSLQTKEKRSYEVMFPGALWHLDFHHGSRMVLLPNGERVVPICLCILDDCTRLCCHIQWYTRETTQVLVHGVIQALLKRGLPRAIMSDNGSAMVSGEFTEGLLKLGIQHDLTLPYSPHQNGKQESFWGGLEGRLIALLQNEKDLNLDDLNRFSNVWAEKEYNHRVHSELKKSPIEKWISMEKVTRSGPSLDDMKNAFRREIERKVRRTDGTFSLEGKRFEIDHQVYRSQSKITIHYAKWDLSRVDIVDPKTKIILSPVYPIDLQSNAERKRRILPNVPQSEDQNNRKIHLKGDLSISQFQGKYRPPILDQMWKDFENSGEFCSFLPFEEEETVSTEVGHE